MTTTTSEYRLPAEWECHNAILIAWPHSGTDWAYMLDEAEDCYVRIVEAVAPYEHIIILAPDAEHVSKRLHGVDPTAYTVVGMPTNDTWTRDYGPITLLGAGRRIVDFTFNGWGLKFAADRDNFVTRELYAQGVLQGDYVNARRLALEGGAIESDGRGNIYTTSSVLFSPNRNEGYTREEVVELTKAFLHAKNLTVIDNGGIDGDDTDGHIDTLARLTDTDTIAYVKAPADPQDCDYAGLVEMEAELSQTGKRLVGLPYAGPVYDPEDGSRLPATYANFLITPRAVFVPTYAIRTDDEALAVVAGLFPGRDVIGIDCRALIRQHGSLHCATMQLNIDEI